MVAAGVGACCTPSVTVPPGSCSATTTPTAGPRPLAQLLSSPRHLATMGAAAARFAGAHGWDVAAARLLEIYGDLVREPVLEQMG